MNRRTFISTAVAGSMAGIAGRSAWGEAAPIGCGLLGIDHAHGMDVLKVLRGLPDYNVVGVCEPDAAVQASFEGKEPLKGLPWLSQEQLLSNPAVQMVAVESFVPRLLDFAEAVIDAGKHLHLDKPAGTDLRQFERILNKAADKNLLVQMGYMFRYNPGFDVIRQAVREGWLGDIYAIHASMCTYQDAEKRKRLSYSDGGMMLELGCHLIDMIILLLGPPDSVTAISQKVGAFDDTLADNCVATFEYADKALVTVETSALEPDAFGSRRFKISGTKGTIVLSPLEPPSIRMALREASGSYPKGVTELDLPDLSRHVLDFQDLARCMREEDTFDYSKVHDYQVQRTVLLAGGLPVD